MHTTHLHNKIAASSKKIKADIVIKNGKIIDVFNLDIIEADLAITDGMFVGIGTYEGEKTIDVKGRYISPSFIDSHVHIESSMVTPSEFSNIVLPHGVTTVITDPHEIANVAGIKGIQFMLDDSEHIPLDVMVMLPSSVPATTFENGGAVLNANDLKPFYSRHRVIGLAEVMDFPSVRDGSAQMMEKLIHADSFDGVIDGHAAGLDETGINIYQTAGISTDHEAINGQEALERVRRGMYVLIREGSAAKDLSSIVPVVNERNARRFLFCTDDKHLDDLIEEGSIDFNVRLAIEEGMDPLLAIQIASLNAAECYQLKQKGALAPGYRADFLILDHLEEVAIHQVYKDGKLVAEGGKCMSTLSPNPELGTGLKDSVRISALSESDFNIPLKGEQANVIGIIPNRLVTNHLIENVDLQEGLFIPSLEKDQLKLAVIERHHKTGNIGLGIVKGFGLTSGAIATTIAHDSHNIVAVATSDKDLLLAVLQLQRIQGGIAIVKNQAVIASMSLPIGGLMTDRPLQEAAASLDAVTSALTEIGCSDEFNPLLTLSFLSLPVIPKLKLTDKGLFHVNSFQHIGIDI